MTINEKKEKNPQKTKEAWMETMHRVASRLTPSVEIKFMEEHDAEMKAEMQRIIKEESLSELETDIEREDYNSEEEDMILGATHREYISKMIGNDFKENGEKETRSTSSNKVLTKTINMEKRLGHMKEMIKKDFEEEE